MSKKKPKYFPNNWKAYKLSPDEFFLPIDYDEFYQWKVMGWQLPSSVSCIIREEDPNTGKITEHVYSRQSAAQKRIEDRMKHDTRFTICDEEAVHMLLPRNALTEHELEEFDDED